MSRFIDEYERFVFTGKYNLDRKNIPDVLRMLDLDIAQAQERIDYLYHVLKIENPPFGASIAIDIRAEIEQLKDWIELCRKRKSGLTK